MEEKKKSKLLRRVLAITGWVLLAAFFGVVIFRIALGNYYPRQSLRTLYSPSLTAYYEANGLPRGLTQDLRAPYTVDEKGKAEGSFFAAGLLWIPDAGEAQITVRYNTASLRKVASFYGKEDYPDAEGNFTYRLTVSYCGEDKDAATEKSYPLSDRNYTAFSLYRYERLAFSGVTAEWEGMPVRWMRVEIYDKDGGEMFGSIVIYEQKTAMQDREGNEVLVDCPTKEYVFAKDEVPQ